jgi:hypothetical protein
MRHQDLLRTPPLLLRARNILALLDLVLLEPPTPVNEDPGERSSEVEEFVEELQACRGRQ